jgi:hypothetical protein
VSFFLHCIIRSELMCNSIGHLPGHSCPDPAAKFTSELNDCSTKIEGSFEPERAKTEREFEFIDVQGSRSTPEESDDESLFSRHSELPFPVMKPSIPMRPLAAPPKQIDFTLSHIKSVNDLFNNDSMRKARGSVEFLKYYDDDSSFGSEIEPPHLDPSPEELLDQCVQFNKGEISDDSISHMSIDVNSDSSDMSADGISVNSAPIDYLHKTEDRNNPILVDAQKYAKRTIQNIKKDPTRFLGMNLSQMTGKVGVGVFSVGTSISLGRHLPIQRID